MRETLFRGKFGSKWKYGYYFVNDELQRYGIIKEKEPYLPTWYVSPETVGQYTGVKDKLGTKIFEGDILEFINDDNEVSYYEVVYSEANCRWIIRQYEGATDDLDDFVGKYMTVVGNIYDNPKLLEV